MPKVFNGAWSDRYRIRVSIRASHAIGHILGGSANVPHGYTSCVMLPHVLEWNASVNAERQSSLWLWENQILLRQIYRKINRGSSTTH